MTRKHFEAIAADFARQNQRINNWSDNSMEKHADGARSALLSLAQNMCATFRTFNPNFDSAKFMKAAGF